jgi:hypothetical protein
VPAAICFAKRGSVRHSGTACPSPDCTTAPAMPMPGGSRTPTISRAPAPHAAWKTSSSLWRSTSATDAAAASKMPAAVRTTASMRLLGASAWSTLSASEAPSLPSVIGAPSAAANACTDTIRRSGMISSDERSVCSSSGVTPGTVSASFVSSAYTGAEPASRFQTVAPSENTSLRGETVPPANTSGAMKRGVPTPTVPVSVASSWVATPKSTSTTPRSPQIRFWGFTSRCTICCSCTYWSASHAWRA